MNISHKAEIESGERFKFGENWSNFLLILDEERIESAIDSLRVMLKLNDLTGKRFVDVGSGSGLFSLAARRMGARVVSFDYDPQSVECTRELKRRYFKEDPDWDILEGSVLDNSFLVTLGKFDIVYSWGVLHHTGQMWNALENVCELIGENGILFISIYNDQLYISRVWRQVKKIYCSGSLGRFLMKAIFIPYFAAQFLLYDIYKLRNPIRTYSEYKRQRGMSRLHDWYDWLGGYPFEVAKPEQIFDFYHERGMSLETLFTCGGGLGCNQFIFHKNFMN